MEPAPGIDEIAKNRLTAVAPWIAHGLEWFGVRQSVN